MYANLKVMYLKCVAMNVVTLYMLYNVNVSVRIHSQKAIEKKEGKEKKRENLEKYSFKPKLI
jgi:hypothetical protein